MENKIIQANIELHSKLVDVYHEEPHFRPENQAKVRKQIQLLQKRIEAKTLLDIGCGTGFIINLAKDLFDEISGVDITQAMLDKVDISAGNIKLYRALAEDMPFDDNCFDMATSYAFLHHLEDYKKVLKEAYRVLKNGGIYYIDLDPNKYFWSSINSLANIKDKNKYSDIVQREIDSVLHTDEKIYKEFSIEPDIVNNAEYTKSILGGIDPEKLCEEALAMGYTKATYEYSWYLGQGSIMHNHSFEEAEKIDSYLKEILPLSKHLYKYLKFVLVK